MIHRRNGVITRAVVESFDNGPGQFDYSTGLVVDSSVEMIATDSAVFNFFFFACLSHSFCTWELVFKV